MSISIISNFNLNQNVPLDYRIVAVNSAAKDAISYKYDGMKVFQQDTRLTYTWNSSTSTWTGDFTSLTNGYIPMFQSPGLTDSSIYEDLTGVYIQNAFYLPSLAASTNNALLTTDDGGYVGSFDIISATTDNDAISLGVGFGGVYYLNTTSLRSMVHPLYATGSFVGINSNSSSTASTPKGNLQINSGSSNSHPPILIDISGSGTIAYNWYVDGLGDEYTFTGGDGCSGIRFDTNGTMKFNAFYGTTPTMTSGDDYMMLIDPRGQNIPTPGIYFQTGNIYADIHNTGGTQSYSHPSISSGTYVPVIGSSSNCVLSAPTGTWNRVGNVVTVSGNVYIDPVSTGTTYFFLSLPVDVVLSGKDSYKLNGIGKFALTGGQGDSCPIVGSTDNTSNAYFDFYATQTNKLMMSYIYQYSMSDIDK